MKKKKIYFTQEKIYSELIKITKKLKKQNEKLN